MKILEIGMSSHIGGVETYFHNYYHKFSLDFHFDFIAVDGEMCFKEEYESSGSVVYSVPDFKRHPIGFYFKLKRILKSGKYDAVHVNMLSLANVLPVIAGHFAKVKVIVHSHNNDTPTGIVRRLLHKVNRPFVDKYADVRLACSGIAGKWMFGNRDFSVITNSMDVAKFSFNEQERADIRNQYKVGDSLLLGHVGRYQEQKNHGYIVKVFNEYHKRNSNSKLLLIGSGNLFDGIKNEIIQLGLIDSVIFVKETFQVEKYYQAMDVFVFPSLFEGLGMVAVEAQLSGLPVICTDSLSREIVITDNVSFVGIEDGDIDKWCVEIDKYSKASIDRTSNINSAKYDIVSAVKIFERCLSEK